MKGKILNFLVIMTSLIGYLEWGNGEFHSFLFQAEGEVFSKLFTEPSAIIHPFILIPLGGQVMLLLSLFLKGQTRFLTYAGIMSIGVLLLMIFLIGILSSQYIMLASTLPFFVTAVMSFKYHRKQAKVSKSQSSLPG